MKVSSCKKPPDNTKDKNAIENYVVLLLGNVYDDDDDDNNDDDDNDDGGIGVDNEWIMEYCKVVRSFESVYGILCCSHSNETSLAKLSHDNICFSAV